jgi:hypothetical protein
MFPITNDEKAGILPTYSIAGVLFFMRTRWLLLCPGSPYHMRIWQKVYTPSAVRYHDCATKGESPFHYLFLKTTEFYKIILKASVLLY